MDRFPRFVLGYLGTFLILLFFCLSSPELHKLGKSMAGALNGFRVMFFLLTFFSIGLVSNFRKLKEEGIAVWQLCTSCACSASSSGWACSFLMPSSTA